MTTLIPNLQAGFAQVAADGSFVWNSGIVASIAHTATGVYTITLNEPIDANEAVMLVQSMSNGATLLGVNLEIVSDTSIVVRIVQET